MRTLVIALLVVCDTLQAQTLNTITGDVTGLGISVDGQQVGSGHLLEFTLNGSHHSLTAAQTGASHSASITANSSIGPSTINVTQSGLTPQTVNILQMCATPSGCSVTVVQGQQ